MKDFRKLQVWQKAHQLAIELYRATAAFPREELYGLTSQIRRCCASIPANIAEGCGRNTDGELARFLEISMGSASELEHHSLLSNEIGFLESAAHEHLERKVIEAKQMLASLIGKVRTTR